MTISVHSAALDLARDLQVGGGGADEGGRGLWAAVVGGLAGGRSGGRGWGRGGGQTCLELVGDNHVCGLGM